MGKTTDAVRALNRVKCQMGPSRGAEFQYGKLARREFGLDVDPVTGCYTGEWSVGLEDSYDYFDGNRVSFTNSPMPGIYPRNASSNAHISYSILNAFGPPLPLKLIPDGSEIVEAHMEVTTSGLTREHTMGTSDVGNCLGEIVTPGSYSYSTTVEDVSYSLVGFPTHKSFDVLGSIPGAANGQKVINCTSLMQAMFSDRATGQYAYGYGVIFLPSDITGTGSVEDLVATEPPAIFTESGDCYPCGKNPFFGSSKSTSITWGGVSIGEVVLQVKYPEEEYHRQILMPRLPMMT